MQYNNLNSNNITIYQRSCLKGSFSEHRLADPVDIQLAQKIEKERKCSGTYRMSLAVALNCSSTHEEHTKEENP